MASNEGARRVLYLSYDGMTDPLGGSQVLPYLEGLALLGHRIHLVSFEKPERSEAERQAVARQCAAAGIAWHPLPYHRRPPILSTLLDLAAMHRLAERLHEEVTFDLVHCRSYIPALAGLRLKRRRGLPFLFDMRGFWADERVEGGLWNLNNPVYRTIFRWFKAREGDFLREADHVVSLTEAGRDTLLGRYDPPPPERITVIPCCADLAAFPPVTPERRRDARARLNISAEARVAVYLGSIGTWYLLDEMLAFFRMQLRRDRRAIFLIVSPNDPEPIRQAARAHGIGDEALMVVAARRAEVPLLVAAGDYGLFFIKPCFSKLASSPVKLGEFFAMGLPVVTNAGVGDVERIVVESSAGVLVGGMDAPSYVQALDELEQLTPDRNRWRAVTRHWFDLNRGVAAYDQIYRGVPSSLNRAMSRGACEARE